MLKRFRMDSPDDGAEDGSVKKTKGLYDRPNAPPSPGRMFEVASGLSEWTANEKAWLAMHPDWIEHEIHLRSTLKGLKADTTSVSGA